jgi:pilus assembly protein CpaE
VNHELKSILESEFSNADQELHLKIYPTLPSVEQAVIQFAPHLMIIGIEPDEKEKKLAFLHHLSGIAVRMPVIVTAPNVDADMLLTCVKKGARDFIKQPFDREEIKEVVNRLILESPMNPQEHQHGLTYSFFSYKGGIGTTFLSCNTAVALSRLTRSRVLLWDMVLQNGDIPFFFDYEPTASLTDLIENQDKIDEAYLRNTLSMHASGISILSGPKRPEDAESIRSDQIQNLHQTLRKYFDHIVVDLGHVITDPVIGVMDNSKHLLLLTDLHLPVLKNTLRCLEVFERLGYVEGKFKIILNRYNSKYEKFDLSKAQEILGYPVAMAVSNDYFTALRSLNTGIPVADLDKNSILTKQFDDLARMLVTSFKAKEEKDQAPSFMEKFKWMKPKPKAKSKPKDAKKIAEPEPSQLPLTEDTNAA